MAHEYRAAPRWHGQDVAISRLTVGVLSFRGRPRCVVGRLLSRISRGQRLALQRAAKHLERQGATIEERLEESIRMLCVGPLDTYGIHSI